MKPRMLCKFEYKKNEQSNQHTHTTLHFIAGVCKQLLCDVSNKLTWKPLNETISIGAYS